MATTTADKNGVAAAAVAAPTPAQRATAAAAEVWAFDLALKTAGCPDQQRQQLTSQYAAQAIRVAFGE